MKKTLLWTPVIMWMVVIFMFSHQTSDSSNQVSSGISEYIIRIVEKSIQDKQISHDFINLFIRKAAHFLIYMILGILTYNALSFNKLVSSKTIVISLIICILYAISDETHQLFVEGRSGEVTDVIIDSLGAFLGIFICFIFKKHVILQMMTKENKYKMEDKHE